MTDGERWARDVLEELRAARYRPGGWARFLARSFERAAEQRRKRRRAHGEMLALGVLGLAVWGGVALAGHPALGAAGAGWWLLVVLMLDWHLGMLDGAESLGAANALCLLRLGLVPALPMLSAPALATALLAAAATDVLDGRLARTRSEESRLGHWLDGAADGLVVSVAAVVALPAWAAALVVARYAGPWFLGTAVYFAGAGLTARVSARAPGFVVLAGLVLVSLGAPLGVLVAATGAAAGLAAVAGTVLREAAQASATR